MIKQSALDSTQQDYLVLCDKLGQDPSKYYQLMPTSTLSNVNQAMAYELQADAKTGDYVVFMLNNLPQVGKLKGYFKGSSKVLAHVWADGETIILLPDSFRKVGVGKNGAIYAKYQGHVVAMTLFGTKMKYKAVSMKSCPNRVGSRLEALFCEYGVDVTLSFEDNVKVAVASLS